MEQITFLVIDDNPDDRILVKRELKREFGEIHIIEVLDNNQFQEFLVKKQFDIVITDYFLQWSNGLEILKAVKNRYPECPVVMFTGTGNEEIAVEAMKEGLDDYVIKSPKHYLRMAKATRSVYEQYRQRQALKEVESQYRRLFEGVPVGLYRISEDGTFLEANLALLDILGYPSREAIKQANLFTDHFPTSALEDLQNQTEDQQQATQRLEIRLYRCNSHQIWVRYSARSVYDEQQNFLYYEGVIEDITQRKEAQAQVSQLLEKEQAAREEAEAANRLKDEFLATLSHELRTPLNSILGWTQMLKRGTLSEKQTTKALSIIERNVRDQTKLVEDLLDVSRIVRGKMKLDWRQVDLYQVVNEAVNIVRPTAEAKSIQLEIVPSALEVVTINGDVERLRQIIWNLLINAIKFTPTGGKVTVMFEQVEEMMMVHVMDTGIGIEPDILPKIFDRFSQVDSSSRRSYSGLGLGLAIVRHLTELHGGSVAATSKGKDQGSTFSVKLPLATAQRSESSLETPGSELEYSRLVGVNVLVVDDEPETLELTTLMLEEHEAKVTAVESVAKALQALARETFEVLISDISMPEADGYDLIKSVRDAHPNLIAIALTAYASEGDHATALETGFDLYLSKPIDADQLLESVESLVKGKEKLVPEPSDC